MRSARFLRRLVSDQHGATAVEFALIALPLATLLMGGFDLGHQAYIRSVMQGALTDAARRASVQDPEIAASGSTTQERVSNSIKDQLKAITPGATITVTESNRMIAEPYPRLMVARDQVNQGAAALLMSVEAARRLGVPSDKWVFLRGHADLEEQPLLQRQDLGHAPSAVMAVREALDMAGIGIDDVATFDLYSCFPVPVFNICDGLGIATDDPRGLTLTGGLPYFGGAGNNYSMHAIAEAVAAVRARPGSYGFVGANGGMLSKYSAGIYSTEPADWSRPEARRGKVPEAHVPGLEVDAAEGAAVLETYTIIPHRDGDVVVAIGRLDSTGRRFAANQADGDAATLEAARTRDPLGRRLTVRTDDQGFNRFVFAD